MDQTHRKVIQEVLQMTAKWDGGGGRQKKPQPHWLPQNCDEIPISPSDMREEWKNGFGAIFPFLLQRGATSEAVSKNMLGSLEALSKRGPWEGFARFCGYQPGVCPPKGTVLEELFLFVYSTPMRSLLSDAYVSAGVHCTHVNCTHTGEIYLRR